MADTKISALPAAAALTGTEVAIVNQGGTTSQTTAGAIAGLANPMTAQGDLIIGGASGALARLALGANGYVLSSNGTTITWIQPVALGSTAAVALGTAAAGTATDASRSDHVHQMPTAANVGAEPALVGSSGFLRYDKVFVDLTGTNVAVADAGGYFTGTDVEAVLQEIGAAIAALQP